VRRTALGILPRAREENKRYLMMDTSHEAIEDVDWLLGGALVMRREAHKQVGSFDERFFLYFDDTDYARRMHACGWRVVYVPEAKMVHFWKRQSAGSLWSFLSNKVTRIHVYSALKYFWKYRKVNPVTSSTKYRDFSIF
jgi:GT2 family glycosyltransferase